MTIAALLLFGLVGSLHCAAMCGPLAWAAADRRSRAGYLVGRTVAYATVGAVLGQAGRHALCELPVGVVQAAAWITVAVAAAVRGVRLLVATPGERAGAPLVAIAPGHPRRSFASALAAFLPRRGLALGLVTAVLPCGMLLPAWAVAAASADPLRGAGVMFAFSLATLPGLLAPLLVAALVPRLRRLSPRVVGAAWMALALWIVVRPLLNAAHHH